MELINRRIGVLVSDPTLRRLVYDLLTKRGARVSCAADEDDLVMLIDNLGLELAVVSVEMRSEPFCPN
jgi:hypothetical protein